MGRIKSAACRAQIGASASLAPGIASWIQRVRRKLAWLVLASFVLLRSPMLFAPPVVNQFDKGFGLEEAWINWSPLRWSRRQSYLPCRAALVTRRQDINGRQVCWSFYWEADRFCWS